MGSVSDWESGPMDKLLCFVIDPAKVSCERHMLVTHNPATGCNFPPKGHTGAVFASDEFTTWVYEKTLAP